MTQALHGTTVARRGVDGWRGLLIAGPSGAGKSDLALRLIARGWRLVADDYTHVWASGGLAYATVPHSIAGQIEARGVGIVPAPTLGLVRLALLVELSSATPERLPEPQFRPVAGVSLPFLSLDPRPASAVEIVTSAIARL
ncbi:HPr kinase/phosphatase C-terminal domain-containing protein [Brevundimonas sp.]|uniref:HPr kinase/phosphorylase n=1 Tax=Brevundimonas sp. TaxID=1871086 RepID=UPI002AB8C20C|nr:HPr kinase/phosphatase C-terminal domain-containing protein [Brevundimonas sp.]MDZ4365066.1 HPr kinase/phosphatase C-terminal domain-containing protein [Brevundimonas sp.]